MAVAHEQISDLLGSHLNQARAANLAVEAYNEFGGVLLGYLRAKLRCVEDAQDLAQEVYFRIARHEDVSQIQSLKAFTFTIAKNLLRDKSRRCATKLSASSISMDAVTLAAAGGDPLEQVEADECMHRIESVVASLRPACREAYLLSRSYGLSYAAIADYTGVSVSMVEKHVSAALRAIRSSCQVN